jgi:hypothetical protein
MALTRASLNSLQLQGPRAILNCYFGSKTRYEKQIDHVR